MRGPQCARSFFYAARWHYVTFAAINLLHFSEVDRSLIQARSHGAVPKPLRNTFLTGSFVPGSLPAFDLGMAVGETKPASPGVETGGQVGPTGVGISGIVDHSAVVDAVGMFIGKNLEPGRRWFDDVGHPVVFAVGWRPSRPTARSLGLYAPPSMNAFMETLRTRAYGTRRMRQSYLSAGHLNIPALRVYGPNFEFIRYSVLVLSCRS